MLKKPLTEADLMRVYTKHLNNYFSNGYTISSMFGNNKVISFDLVYSNIIELQKGDKKVWLTIRETPLKFKWEKNVALDSWFMFCVGVVDPNTYNYNFTGLDSAFLGIRSSNNEMIYFNNKEELSRIIEKRRKRKLNAKTGQRGK